MQVSQTNVLPTGMVRVPVPAARYAKFCHQGPVQNLDNTVNYIYSSWLQSCGYVHSGGPDLEFYDSRYSATSDDSLMHYAIPIG
jgi:AraC family transcriptional regulator